MGRLTIETHLLDGPIDLYDRTLRLAFVRWIREEQTFDDLETLKQAIAGDCAQASALFRRMAL